MRKGKLSPNLGGKQDESRWQDLAKVTLLERGNDGWVELILCPVQAAHHVPLEPFEMADAGPLFDPQHGFSRGEPRVW